MKPGSKGSSLVEVMLASLVLLVGVVGVMNLFTVAVRFNNTNGELVTRITEHCQDKMEQLSGLSFGDGGANTTVRPVAPTGGTGLGGDMPPNTTVGSVNPAAVVIGYADYLSAAGDPLPDADGAFYIRQWSISTDSTAKLKTITVYTATVNNASRPPSTTLVLYKSAFF